jgi:uncharacterized protein (DUF952 family)
MSGRIYHIAQSDRWELQRPSGEYRHPSLETEGFIHCSLAEQVPGTLEKFFPSREGLVLLEIDVARLSSELRYENGYPHLYGPLDAQAVIKELPVAGFQLPAE